MVANHKMVLTLEEHGFSIIDRIMTEERARNSLEADSFLSDFQELDKESCYKNDIVVDEEQTSSVTQRINQDFAGATQCSYKWLRGY